MQKVPQITLKIFVTFLLGIYSLSLLNYPVYSDEVEDLEKQIAETNEQIAKNKGVLSEIEKKIAEISGSNYSLSQKIGLINDEVEKLQADIDNTDAEIEGKLKEIEEKQIELAKRKTLLDEISSELYMQSRYRMSSFFLSTSSWNSMMENLFVKKNTISILRDEIEMINGEFSNLTDAKANLDKQKEELDSKKKDLDKSYELLAAEKAKLQKELNAQVASKKNVSTQIGNLAKEISTLQNYLLVAKSGGTIVNSGSVPQSTSDPGSSQQYFLSNAPSGSFAVFSFGGYTYRNGMSQWGAKARAEAGQTYTQILETYYPNTVITTGQVRINGVKVPIMTKINVEGYGKIAFEEDYLLGIKEVPESWPIEVLKAQAIAARTYAVRYTGNDKNKSICTTESCQVFSKPVKTGAWKQAVEATRGMILTDTNKVAVLTQYAAVHGGWINGRGWDTVDGSGSGDWMGRSWESRSGVSWFYKNWFRKDYATSGSDCGHKPWLNMEEMADLVNAYLLWTDKGKPDSDPRIVSIDVSKCWGQAANPYSMAELRDSISNPVRTITNVVSSNSNGTTGTLTFNTVERGLVSIKGDDFKKIYNMRAPSYLRIPQWNFVHINVEKK